MKKRDPEFGVDECHHQARQVSLQETLRVARRRGPAADHALSPAMRERHCGFPWVDVSSSNLYDVDAFRPFRSFMPHATCSPNGYLPRLLRFMSKILNSSLLPPPPSVCVRPSSSCLSCQWQCAAAHCARPDGTWSVVYVIDRAIRAWQRRHCRGNACQS